MTRFVMMVCVLLVTLGVGGDGSIAVLETALAPGAPSASSVPAKRWFGDPLVGTLAPQAPALRAELRPTSTVPGGIVWVHVSGAMGATRVSVDSDLPRWAGDVYPVGSGAEGVIGVDMSTDPGTYQIEVQVQTAEGATHAVLLPLQVEPFAFQVQHLHVSPALQAVRSRELWRPDSTPLMYRITPNSVLILPSTGT